MKNLLSGNSNEKTWRAGESVTAADVNTFEAQYSYEEDDNYVFMDSEYVECPETCVSWPLVTLTSYICSLRFRTFEEIRASKLICKEPSKYFKEGMELQLISFKGSIIGVKLPNTMIVKVIQCDPNVKGNSAQGVTKPAKIETGHTLTVPGFIAEGEMIKVNTELDQYTGRANEKS